VGKPTVEKVGVSSRTHLFFQFRYYLPIGFVFRLVLVLVVGFFILAECERVAGFIVGVERIDEILPPDMLASGVIVVLSATENFVSGSLEY